MTTTVKGKRHSNSMLLIENETWLASETHWPTLTQSPQVWLVGTHGWCSKYMQTDILPLPEAKKAQFELNVWLL